MQLLCDGAIIFYDMEENPSADYALLSRASLAFMVTNQGRFRVIKDRLWHFSANSIVSQEIVNKLIQEYFDFNASSESLAELLTDGKGLSFLGASAKSEVSSSTD